MNDGLEERRETTIGELELAREELQKKSKSPKNGIELWAVIGILQMTEFAITVLESEERYFPRWFQWIVLSILNPWTGSRYRKFLKLQRSLEDFDEDALLIDEEDELVNEGSLEAGDISGQSDQSE